MANVDFSLLQVSNMLLDSHCAQQLNVKVKLLSGEQLTFMALGSDTVMSLKTQLQEKTGSPTDEQILLLNDLELDDFSPLHEYHHLSSGPMCLSLVTKWAVSECVSPEPKEKGFVLQLALIISASFTTSIKLHQIRPYISKMIMSFGLADRSTTGYYTGMLVGVLMVCRGVSSPFWGSVTDTKGRKPVLLISLFFSALSCVMFGFTTEIYSAIVCMAISGLFVPCLLVAKACITEVCPAYYRNRGMAWQSTAMQLGLVAGSFIGGSFESPSYGPQLFQDYPYLLPNLLSALMCMLSFIGIYFWFNETLVVTNGHGLMERETDEYTFSSLLHDRVFLIVVGTYGISSFLSSGSYELIALWSWAGIEDGGLQFGTSEIGYSFGISTCFLVVTQQAVYSALVDTKGLRWMCLFNTLCSVPVTMLIPFISAFAYNQTVSLSLLTVSQWLWTFLNFQILTAQYCMINNSASQRQRGKANGLGMTIGSLGRALAPPILSACFAFTASSSFPWPFNYSCAFNLMALMAGAMYFLITLIPASIENAKHSH